MLPDRGTVEGWTDAEASEAFVVVNHPAAHVAALRPGQAALTCEFAAPRWVAPKEESATAGKNKTDAKRSGWYRRVKWILVLKTGDGLYG